MTVVVIIQLTSPAPWQPDSEAAYGPFPSGADSAVQRLTRMAHANHGAASVTVLPLKPMPEVTA